VRGAFIGTLTKLASEDPSILLMTGDLGFGVFNEYREQLGGQFLNVGVAEQNLAGVAAGIALTGHHVFTYSIGNFPTLRCLEQLRNDVCYHEANVTVVTVGGGMAYGTLGPSHFALEDLAIMRVLPNMTVVAPGDPLEVRALVPQLKDLGGPSYLRLGRAGEPDVHPPGTEIILGRPAVVRSGQGVCVLSTGGMLPVAVKAVDILAKRTALSPTLASVHTLAGVEEDGLRDLIRGHDLVITCEEHSVIGGLGGFVAEYLAEHSPGVRLVRIGLPRSFPTGIGSQEHMRKVNSLDALALERQIAEAAGILS